jgi:hypothetical protein
VVGGAVQPSATEHQQQQQQQQQATPPVDPTAAALLQVVQAMQLQQQQQAAFFAQLQQQQRMQQAAPAAVAPFPLALALHTAQEIPKLADFSRPAFLIWSREFDAYRGRCEADGLRARATRYAFPDAMVSQVLSALGKPRGDSRSAHWIGLADDAIVPGLELFFFKDITAAQVLQMYKGMTLKPANTGYPAVKAAFDAFAHEVVSLDSALERVSKGGLLERKAHCDVVLATLRSNPILAASTAQFRFEAAGALFDHVQGDLDAILAFMGRFAHFPSLFHSPSVGGRTPDATTSKVAVAGVSIPCCDHCGKQGHSEDRCWFLHIRKKPGARYIVISKEERERKLREKGVKPRPRGASRPTSPAPVNANVYSRGAQRRRRASAQRARQQQQRQREGQARPLAHQCPNLQPQPRPSQQPMQTGNGRQRRATQQTAAVHTAAAATAAGGSEPELEVGWASLVLDGGFPVGAFLDSGSVTHNFVCKKVARALRDRGLVSSPAAFRVTGVGAVTAGAASETIECMVQRCKGGHVQQSSETFLVFDTGFDVLVSRATLVEWGWLREWEDVARSEWSLDGELKEALQGLRKDCKVRPASTVSVQAARATPLAEATRQARQRSLQLIVAPLSAAAVRANEKWQEAYGGRVVQAEDAPVAWQVDDAGKRRRQLKRARARGVTLDEYLRGAREVVLRAEAKERAGLVARGRWHALAWRLRRASSGVTPPAKQHPSAPSPKPSALAPVPERRVHFLLNSCEQRKAASKGTRFHVPGVGRVRATAMRPTPWRSKAPLKRVPAAGDFARSWRRRVVTLLVVQADEDSDPAAVLFRQQLAALKREFGMPDETDIFSPDISEPSKMAPMKLPLVPGADPHSIRPYAKRFTPPMKEEMRTQVNKMLKYAVCQRGDGNTVVSNVHLARKPEKPPPLPGAESQRHARNDGSGGDRAPRGSQHAGRAMLPLLPENVTVSYDGTGGNVSQDSLPKKAIFGRKFSPQAAAGAHGGAGSLAASRAAPGASFGAAGQSGASVPAKPRWRFCIDYRKVNRICVQEHYPLPETRECIEYLAGGEIFGSADLSAMYWQIELDEGSRYLTGFQTEDGVYEMRRVPFGLKSAVAHAQREFRRCLRSDPRLSRVYNYIDDCFWCARGPDRHADFLEQTRAFFEMCRRFNIKLSAEKTVLGGSSIRVLGHIVDRDGVRIDPARSSAITAMPEPTSIKTLEASLGAMGYVRSFVDGFSVLAAPLTGLKQWVWGAEQRSAFSTLKEAIARAGTLSNPDYNRNFFIQADTSKTGTGGTLWQWGKDGGGREVKKIISYCSKKFNARESRWKTIEQECFGLIFALQKFRQFVQGCPVTLLTDHRNIKWLNSNETSSKIIRWAMVLDEHVYTIEHVPGKSIPVEDSISRLSAVADAPDDIPAEAWASMSLRERVLLEREGIQVSVADAELAGAGASFTDGDGRVRVHRDTPVREHARVLAYVLAAARAGDVELMPVRAGGAEDALLAAERRAARAQGGEAGAASEQELAAASKAMLRMAKRLAAAAKPIANTNARWRQARESAAPASYGGQRGLAAERTAREAQLRRGQEVADDDPGLLVWSELGEEEKKAHLERLHAFPMGHGGVGVTVQRLLRSGKFSMRRGQVERMREDAAAFKRGCPACQLLQDARRGGLTMTSVPARPFVDLSVDVLSLSPADDEGHDAVVVMVDNFSGWCELIPTKSVTSEAIVRYLVQYFGRYGAPVVVRSDQDSTFVSKLVDGFYAATGIQPNRTIPHHPESNGVVERCNREVLQLTSAMTLDERVSVDCLSGWCDVLPFVQRIINSSVTRKTGFSPSQLIFGDAVDLDRLIFDAEGDLRRLETESADVATGLPRRKVGEYVQTLIDTQEACLRAALDHQRERLAKALAGRQVAPATIVNPGQWVLVRFPEDQNRDKLVARWNGPYRVLKVDSESVIVVYDTVRDEVKTVHVDDLVLFDWSWWPSDTAEDVKTAHAERLARRGAGGPRRHLIVRILNMRIKGQQTPVPADFARKVGGRVRPWGDLEFLVEWSKEGSVPSWVPFERVSRTEQLEEFRRLHPEWC